MKEIKIKTLKDRHCCCNCNLHVIINLSDLCLGRLAALIVEPWNKTCRLWKEEAKDADE